MVIFIPEGVVGGTLEVVGGTAERKAEKLLKRVVSVS